VLLEHVTLRLPLNVARTASPHSQWGNGDHVEDSRNGDGYEQLNDELDILWLKYKI